MTLWPTKWRNANFTAWGDSHIVLSTQFDGRPVEPPSTDTRTVT